MGVFENKNYNYSLTEIKDENREKRQSGNQKWKL